VPAPKRTRAAAKPKTAAKPTPAEPAAKTEPKVEKPALVLDFARAVCGALKSKHVTDADVIRVLDAMITRATRTDNNSTAGQNARHAGVEAVSKLADLMVKNS
jgi:hypothetical protein